jgi:hypothetical protein
MGKPATHRELITAIDRYTDGQSTQADLIEAATKWRHTPQHK